MTETHDLVSCEQRCKDATKTAPVGTLWECVGCGRMYERATAKMWKLVSEARPVDKVISITADTIFSVTCKNQVVKPNSDPKLPHLREPCGGVVAKTIAEWLAPKKKDSTGAPVSPYTGCDHCGTTEMSKGHKQNDPIEAARFLYNMSMLPGYAPKLIEPAPK